MTVAPIAQKVRPHRSVFIDRVRRPPKPVRGCLHLIYVFRVPSKFAMDTEAIKRLHAGCDLPAYSKKHRGVSDWNFVNAEMIIGWKGWQPLQADEIGLLIPIRWRIRHMWQASRSRFYVDLKQFDDCTSSCSSKTSETEVEGNDPASASQESSPGSGSALG